MSKFDELQSILDSMDIPEIRKGDLRWLSRNIGIKDKNREHPEFDKALLLIAELMTSKSKALKKEDNF